MTGLALSIARQEMGLDGEGALDSGAAIEAFLKDVEARAYRIAVMGVRDRDDRWKILL